MSVHLVMLAGGRAANPVAAIVSVVGLADSAEIVDTGISGEARSELEEAVRGCNVEIIDDPWDGSGPGFTRALQRAKGKADWILHLHSDEVAEFHPDLGEWLAADESPETDAWMVEIKNPNLRHRLPRLLRGNQDWVYHGCAHEYLDITNRWTRSLLGLTLHHHGSSDPAKFEEVLEALKPGVAAGEPRAVFYAAEALRDLGHTHDAIVMYDRRANIKTGFGEERWYARYQSALLREDVEGLLVTWSERPWRHEPLQAAASLVALEGARDDILFVGCQ